MTRRREKESRSPLTFAEAREEIAGFLVGPARREIVDGLLAGTDEAGAFGRLRRAMGANAFGTAHGPVSLRRIVDALDARTRREGLHVLHGWDFRAQRRPDDTAAVLLLDYCVRLGIPPGRARPVLAMLLDQYCLGVLSLLVVRAWDDGEANANLDAASTLIDALQGPDGSGQQTVDDAETLLMLAVSYYHPEEAAYDRLLDRVRGLDDAHALRLAVPCASILGSHLRWGLRFMYRSDVAVMRADNVVDYPWLLFALRTLMRAYDRSEGGALDRSARDRIAAALLDGLSADPWAFDGAPPAFLAAHSAEHNEFRDLLGRHRSELIADFERLQPRAGAYSPLGFACNFLSNAVVATVATALADPAPHASLNVLFDGEPSGPDGARAAPAATSLAERLMAYAAGDPDRLAKGGAPLIVYDRFDGVHVFNTTLRVLRGAPPAT